MRPHIKIKLLAEIEFVLKIENYPPGWDFKQALEYEVQRVKEDPEMFFELNPTIEVTGNIK